MIIIPQSLEAEQSGLACMLLDPTLATELDPSWLHDLRHQRIADAIIEMTQARRPVTVESLVEFLGPAISEAGGLTYVATLPDQVSSAYSWPAWKKELIGLASMRRLQNLCSEYAGKVQEKNINPDDLLQEFEGEAFKLRGHVEDGECADMRSLIKSNANAWEEAEQHPGEYRGLRTGFSDLDDVTHGLRPGWLVVLAGRPGSGKTAFGLNIASNLALAGHPVGILSLEMTRTELAMRLQCARAQVDQRKAESGRLDDREKKGLIVAAGRLSKAPIHIDDTGGLTIGRLVAKARRMTRQHALKLLVVDYLQLLRGSNPKASRYEQVTELSNGMKALSKELSIPVLCLAQLNRSNEQDDRPPRVSDLRDSGAIEQDADLILLLHERDGGTDLIVGKNRHGPTGHVRLQFKKEWSRFFTEERQRPAGVAISDLEGR